MLVLHVQPVLEDTFTFRLYFTWGRGFIAYLNICRVNWVLSVRVVNYLLGYDYLNTLSISIHCLSQYIAYLDICRVD
jgi:hypothetical protein